MVCSSLIIMSPYSGQSHSLLRLPISIFIDKNVSGTSQEVVVVRYLQQCVVLNVFQNKFSSGDICVVAIRFTHIAMHEVRCADNLQAQRDCERKATSCSQDGGFARGRFAV